MVKVLISGDTKGRFDALFKAAQRANDKAGPFEALFCVGQFFGPSGRYILLPNILLVTSPLPAPL